MRWIFPVLGLAGCVAASAGSEPTDATISFGNRGSITGYGSVTTVAANDQVSVRFTGPGAPSDPPTVTMPGSYARSADILATDGLALQKALPAEGEGPVCNDYGADRVSASPPIKGFAEVSAHCSDDRVLRLIADLQAVVAR